MQTRCRVVRMNIVQEIAKAMEASGQTRAEIWRATGIDQAILHRIVSESRCSMKHANQLCDYLGLELRPTRRTRNKRHGNHRQNKKR